VSERYCVLIPAYNAAKTVGEVVRGAREQGADVVVVDDGSTDGTAAAASREGALVISHVRNQGKGAALQTGFAYALRTECEGVVTIDGDGQHDPHEIPRLIAEGRRQHAGLVIGNRLRDGAVMPPLRRWTNWLMSKVISRLARQPIPDSQCGFRVIRKEVLRGLPMLQGSRFDFETELILAAARQRWKTVSIPVRAIYRGEPSHIRPLQDALRFVLVVLRYAGRR
jgi:glycosyltransferase involved in cell wall biosynthesis